MSDRFNLTALALKQRELAWFFIVLIGIGGVLAYFQLGQREDPDFTVRMMVIRTLWTGATTSQVDSQVTDRILKTLQEIPYYKVATSYSRSGESIIILELLDSSPPAKVPELWYQVRKKLGDIQYTLPPGVMGPSYDDEWGDVFGSIYALTGDGYTQAELRTWADITRQRLVKLQDVAKVELVGVQPEQIAVNLSTQRLATLGISPLAIAAAIQAQNIIEDTGRLHGGDYAVPLRVQGNFESLDDVRQLVMSINGTALRLGDIAEITRGYVDPPEILMRYAGKPAVGVAVSMKPRGDVLRLGQELDRSMAALEAELPLGLEFARVSNQPAIVSEAVNEFMRAFLEAVAIVLLVSFLSLGWRAGMVVAVTIPLVVCATFLLMRQFEIDLQRVSTGALIIALGLLVDDAMIVVEMMARKLEEGLDRISAAAFAYRATVFPMLTGTLVTAAGFLPIGTAKSTTGEYTFSIFAVVCLALLVSWVAAIFVTPLAGYHLLKAHEGQRNEVFDTPFYNRLRALIEGCLQHRKTVLIGTLLLFLAGVAGMAFTEKQFFPSSNRAELMVELWLPEGASIYASERESKRLEALLAKDTDIESFVTYIGYGSPRFFLSLDQKLYRPNYSQAVVLTKDLDSRERAVNRLRTLMDTEFAGMRTRVQRVPLGPPVTYPVEFRVLGDDLAQLKLQGDAVAEIMRADKRLRDVHADWGYQSPVLRVDVDQDRARAAGVSSAAIARTLRGVAEGIPMGQFREADQLIDIVLRSPLAERVDLSQLASINIPSANGLSVPLSQVARVQPALEEPILWRRNRDLSLSVRADIIDGVQAADISLSLNTPLDALRATLPPGFRIEVGGDFGENMGAQASIMAGMPLMMAVILGLLMLQLKSLSRTIMVVLTAPLGIIGVALALLLFQKPFGFVAMLGTIALGGMIMRNTVILIDQIRQDREAGLADWEAIRESTVRRFRPIVLTSAASILAMIPLTRSVLWGPMAFAIMGGLLVATLLTILFVPALYASWFRVKVPAAQGN